MVDADGLTKREPGIEPLTSTALLSFCCFTPLGSSGCGGLSDCTLLIVLTLEKPELSLLNDADFVIVRNGPSFLILLELNSLVIFLF